MLHAGDVVVMDNLAAHKVTDVREAILAADASLLYLLSYSPDLNPIEQAFAKLKTLWRKAAARSREALGITIGDRWMLAGPRKAATTSSTAATRSSKQKAL
jgi:transposase